MTPPPAPDPVLAEWARGVRSGDLDAFEALFRHLHPMLTRLARQLADDAAADDAVQEAFARLWERREHVDPARSVRAYLARAVRNRLLNASRDAAGRRAILDAHAPDVRPAPPPRPARTTSPTGRPSLAGSGRFSTGSPSASGRRSR